MGVLIKDMKLPKNCINCPIYNIFEHKCELYSFGIPARYYYVETTRPKWCELVEIPENYEQLFDEKERKK